MIGEYNRRITIQPPGSSTQDEGGGAVLVLGTSYEVWAKVTDRSGNALTNNGQRSWGLDMEFSFRYEPSRLVKSNMLIVYDGKTFTINSLSFENEGNKKYNVCRCSTTEIV